MQPERTATPASHSHTSSFVDLGLAGSELMASNSGTEMGIEIGEEVEYVEEEEVVYETDSEAAEEAGDDEGQVVGEKHSDSAGDGQSADVVSLNSSPSKAEEEPPAPPASTTAKDGPESDAAAPGAPAASETATSAEPGAPAGQDSSAVGSSSGGSGVDIDLKQLEAQAAKVRGVMPRSTCACCSLVCQHRNVSSAGRDRLQCARTVTRWPRM